PISLLYNLQKIFSYQLLTRLKQWITKNQVLSHLQAGFRDKISTIDQIFRFTTIKWKTVDADKGHLFVAFVD
ncbi:hypothetical protein NDU88_007020, partial [Pleurodeles waltl]